MVFDKPEFSVKKPESFSKKTHLMRVWLNSGGFKDIQIVIGSGFYHYFNSFWPYASLDDVNFYLDQEDTNKWYFGINFNKEKGHEGLDLWSYTNSTLPTWIKRCLS